MKRRLKLGSATLLSGVALFIGLWLQDLVPHPWPIGLLICLIVVTGAFAVISAALKFDDITTGVQWFPAEPVEAEPAFGAAEPRLRALRKTLGELAVDPEAGEELHRSLRVLAYDRLQARGISGDPASQESRAALGPKLDGYLRGPPPKSPSARTLTDVVSRIEEL